MWYISWDAHQRTKEDCITMINIEIDAQKGEIVKEYHSFFWEYNNPYDKVPAPVIIFDKSKLFNSFLALKITYSLFYQR